MAFVKPVQPDCEGRQFARNPYDSDNYLSVSRDQYLDEVPEDRPMHTESTPGHSNPSHTGKHYADDFSGYGVSVADKGQSPSRETADVNPHAADRGKES